MNPRSEQQLIRFALEQRFLTPAQLRAALLLQDELLRAGRAVELLAIVRARYLSPEHVAAMSRAYRQLQAGQAPHPATLPDATQDLPADLLLSSEERAARPPEEDPEHVQGALHELAAHLGDTASVLASGAGGDALGARIFAGVAKAVDEARQVETRLGPYEVIEELARGGMGVVYRARHPKLDREVALKVLVAGEMATQSQLERFQIEARAAARLRHPNIVAIHDVGQAKGQHYFVMDLIDGESLEDRLKREGRLAPREAARIALTVAEALYFAHTKAIIHRDIKPANILLPQGGAPLVSDFGLAKEVDAEGGLTASGQLLGTPGYMPPEQIQGQLDRIDRRSDIYSLGVTLYVMLSGRLPFDGETAMSVIQAAIDEEPVPLDQAQAGLDRDLVTIVHACIAREPELRYDSAEDLANDLKSYLADEPIQARQASLPERLQKWTRRNRALTALGTASAVALLLVGGAGTAYHVRQVEQALDREADARARAEAARGDAQEKERAARDAAGEARRAEGQTRRALDEAKLAVRRAEAAARREGLANRANLLILARALSEKGERLLLDGRRAQAAAFFARSLQLEESSRARSGLARAFPPRWRLAWETPRPTGALSLAFSPRGDRLAVGQGPTLAVYALPDWRQVSALQGHQALIHSVAFGPRGRRLLSGSADGTANLWDLSQGTEVSRRLSHRGPVYAVACSPDGERIATAGADGKIRLWRADGRGEKVFGDRTGKVLTLAFARDGKRLASGSAGGWIQVWEVPSGRTLRTLEHRGAVRAVTFVGSNRLASAGGDAAVRVWDLRQTGAPAKHLGGHAAEVLSLAATRDGRRLASGGGDGAIRIWDPARGATVRVLRTKASLVPALGFSPDGRTLGVATERAISVWSIAEGQRIATQRGHHQPVRDAAFSSDGNLIASVDAEGALCVWRGGRAFLRRRVHEGPIHALTFVPNSAQVAFATTDGRLRLYDIAKRRPVGGGKIFSGKGLPALAHSPDGRLLAVSVGADVTVWRSRTSGKKIATLAGKGTVIDLAFSPDSRTLATATGSATIRLWNLQARKATVVRGPGGAVTAVRFAADGRSLVTGSQDGAVRVWALKTKRVRVIGRHDGPIRSVAIDRRGALVAAGDARGAVQVWSFAKGERVAALHGHRGAITRVAFAPDGRALLSASADHSVRLWRATRPGVRAYLRQGHSVSLDPAGRRVVSARGDRQRVWDAKSGDALANVGGFTAPIVGVAFHDANTIVSGSADGRVNLQNATTGKARRSLRIGRRKLERLVLSPSGRHLITWGDLVAKPKRGSEILPEAKQLRVVQVWDLERRTELAKGGLATPDTQAVFRPDGKLAAWGTVDGAVQLWDVAAAKRAGLLRRAERRPGAQITCLQFSPDGKLLAAGGTDNTLRLWDPASKAQVGVLFGHGKRPRALAFSRDGRTLVSGAEDTTVRVWDVASRGERFVLRGHAHPVESVAISPDGRTVYSADRKWTVRVWSLARLGLLSEPDDLVEQVWRATGFRAQNLRAVPVTNRLTKLKGS